MTQLSGLQIQILFGFVNHEMNLSASFVIPCFQASDTLMRAVQSAIDGTISDIEVIVVDDASTDNSVALAQSIDDSRVRVIPQRINRGPSFCRNVGIDASSGQWIAVLDADDWIATERLETLLRFADSGHFDLIADNQWIVNQRGEKLRKRFDSFDSFGSREESGIINVGLNSVIQNLGVGITKPLIRRDFLNRHRIRYRPEFKYGEDYRLIFDLVCAGARFGLLDEPFYNAELVEGSLTSDRVAMYKGMIDVLKSVRDHLPGDNASKLRSQVNQAIQDCHRTIAYGAVIDPLKQRRITAAVRAMVQYPSFWTQLPARVSSMMRGKPIAKHHNRD